MNWQQAERELVEWEDEGCGMWMVSCPITHGPHGSCSGLTLGAHSLMFARLYEKNAKEERGNLAAIGG